jgi:hypothetical protein
MPGAQADMAAGAAAAAGGPTTAATANAAAVAPRVTARRAVLVDIRLLQ